MSSPERGSVKSEEEEPVVGSPGQDEFVSDTFAEAEISDEDLQKEMEMLNMENDPAENGGWSGLVCAGITQLCLTYWHVWQTVSCFDSF